MIPVAIATLVSRAKTWGWGLTVASAILATGGTYAYANLQANKFAPKSAIYALKEDLNEHLIGSAALAGQVASLTTVVDQLSDEVRMLRHLLIERLDRLERLSDSAPSRDSDTDGICR